MPPITRSPTARPATRPAAATAARPTPARTTAAPATRPAPRPPVAAAGPARKKFVYHDRPAGTVAAHANQSVGSYDSFLGSRFPMYKVRDGHNSIRIMPPTFDYEKLGVDPHYGMEIHVHYGVGPDEAAYLCRHEMLGELCSLCDERRALAGVDPDAAKALKPVKRYLVWLIDRYEPTAGPKVYAMSASMDKEFCLRSRNKKTGAVLKIDHPEVGYDLEFFKEGSKKNTQYRGYEVSREPSPLSDNPTEAEKWLDYIQQNPVDSALQWYDDAYIVGVFQGAAERADELDESGAGVRDAVAEDDQVEEQPAEGEGDPQPEEEVVEEEVVDEEQPAEGEGDPRPEEEALAEEPEPEPEPEEAPPPTGRPAPGARPAPASARPAPVARTPQPVARTAAAPATRAPGPGGRLTAPSGGKSPVEQARERMNRLRPPTR